MKTFNISVLGRGFGRCAPGWNFTGGHLCFEGDDGQKIFSTVKSNIEAGFGKVREGVFHRRSLRLVNRHHHEHEDAAAKDFVLVAMAFAGNAVRIEDCDRSVSSVFRQTLLKGKVQIVIFLMRKDKQVLVSFVQNGIKRNIMVGYDDEYLDMPVRIFENGISEEGKVEKPLGFIRRLLLRFKKAA